VQHLQQVRSLQPCSCRLTCSATRTFVLAFTGTTGTDSPEVLHEVCNLPASMAHQHCQPRRADDHAKTLHAQCSHIGCTYKISFCYNSLLGPLQSMRCPAHVLDGSGMEYHLHGLPPGIAVTPAFHPAQERFCSCGCRGPVKFTSYCSVCGWPEDLCAKRIDVLRTSLFDGHSQFTHCSYCPNLSRRALVPATSSTAADWANFLRAGAGIRDLLKQAGAETALHNVAQFMRLRSLSTWHDFLRHFETFLLDFTPHTFLAAPGHVALFKLVFHHYVAAEAQHLLYRGAIQFYKASPRFKDSPEYDESWSPTASAINDKYQFPMDQVMAAINNIAIHFTNRPAACLDDWVVIINGMLAALTRPSRQVFLLPSRFLTAQPFVDMVLSEQHVLDLQPEGDVYASATAASMLAPSTIALSDELREFLGAQTSHDRVGHLDGAGRLPPTMVGVSQPVTPPM